MEEIIPINRDWALGALNLDYSIKSQNEIGTTTNHRWATPNEAECFMRQCERKQIVTPNGVVAIIHYEKPNRVTAKYLDGEEVRDIADVNYPQQGCYVLLVPGN